MAQQNIPIGLFSDESILWQGNPAQNNKHDGITVPLLIFMAIVLILGVIMLVMHETKLALYGCLPILLICGLYFAAIGFMEYRRRQIFFIITDRRIVRCDGIFTKKMQDARFRQISDILLKYDSRSKVGAIIFKLKNGELATDGTSEIVFAHTNDAVSVYNLAQKQLSQYRESKIN